MFRYWVFLSLIFVLSTAHAASETFEDWMAETYANNTGIDESIVAADPEFNILLTAVKQPSFAVHLQNLVTAIYPGASLSAPQTGLLVQWILDRNEADSKRIQSFSDAKLRALHDVQLREDRRFEIETQVAEALTAQLAANGQSVDEAVITDFSEALVYEFISEPNAVADSALDARENAKVSSGTNPYFSDSEIGRLETFFRDHNLPRPLTDAEIGTVQSDYEFIAENLPKKVRNKHKSGRKQSPETILEESVQELFTERLGRFSPTAERARIFSRAFAEFWIRIPGEPHLEFDIARGSEDFLRSQADTSTPTALAQAAMGIFSRVQDTLHAGFYRAVGNAKFRSLLAEQAPRDQGPVGEPIDARPTQSALTGVDRRAGTGPTESLIEWTDPATGERRKGIVVDVLGNVYHVVTIEIQAKGKTRRNVVVSETHFSADQLSEVEATLRPVTSSQVGAVDLGDPSSPLTRGAMSQVTTLGRRITSIRGSDVAKAMTEVARIRGNIAGVTEVEVKAKP